MFLNCDEFVEINLDLLATYLFTDFSKTFTNVLQITKFYKNHKKISQRGKLRAGQSCKRQAGQNKRAELGKSWAALGKSNVRAGQTAGRMQIFFLLLTEF